MMKRTVQKVSFYPRRAVAAGGAAVAAEEGYPLRKKFPACSISPLPI